MGCIFRFRPNSEWGSIETMTFGMMHPNLEAVYGSQYQFETLNKSKLLNEMIAYLEQPGCRRMRLLRYFDKNAKSKVHLTLDCCDNCKGTKLGLPQFIQASSVEKADFSRDGRIVFDAIDDQTGGCAATKLIKFIRGSKGKDVPEFLRHKPTYGKGKEKSDAYWRDLIKVRDQRINVRA